jgi:PAS domain S-box-containing protein
LAEPFRALPVPIDRSRLVEHARPAELFRLLVEGIRDYAIFVLDPDGYVLTWNPGAQALKGYTQEEIIGRHFSTFYPSEAVQSGWPQRELALAQKEGRFADEGWRVRKDGTSFWASVVISALFAADGTISGFAKVTQDLTARREAEERVQSLNRELRERVSQLDETGKLLELRTLELQKLSGRLLQIQDEERRRIARELHDDLGQQLTLIKMELAKFNGVSEVNRLTDIAAATVRNISYLLHPPLLDETGLRAALHWYIEGIAKRSNIDISLTFRPQTFPRLPSDIEATIFRIIQESLTNVCRHANSESARVEIEKQSETITVRVRDYGEGLPPELANRSISSGLGVGVSGMRERVRQFGGDLTISRAEPGTLIEARIPLFGSDKGRH